MIASETFVCQSSFQVICPNDAKNQSRLVTSKHSIDLSDNWSEDNSTSNVETIKRSIFNNEDISDEYDSRAENNSSSVINKTDNSSNPLNFQSENIQKETFQVESGGNSSNVENKTDNSSIDNSSSNETCHPNVVAICQTKPEIVTVTEQRQLCSNKKRERKFDSNPKNFVTTKICITYKDGSWFCKNLVKLIAYEMIFLQNKMLIQVLKGLRFNKEN